jgi:hypothetical protein
MHVLFVNCFFCTVTECVYGHNQYAKYEKNTYVVAFHVCVLIFSENIFRNEFNHFVSPFFSYKRNIKE